MLKTILSIFVTLFTLAPMGLGNLSPVAQPGYKISIVGIKKGTCHEEFCNSYNGNWYVPIGGLNGRKKLASALDPSGPDSYDCSGLYPKRSRGCGTGFGDERMELVVENNLVQVIRVGGKGGRIVWKSTTLGNVPLVFSQQRCDGSMSICTVEFLNDIDITDTNQ